ncbi:S24 family peptidase [Azorhizophilus paspali]|uniref:Helix-turn-helix transcriptional regulator n=1 Tax=Azorhizophilus paspali TaxID=69963 RepID=A0ABV6SFP2_AZOPA
MLTGKELGAAIEAARLAKGVSKKKLADDFDVKPPSVQGWVNYGRIDKAKLMQLIAYFSNVVPPEHWGLDEQLLRSLSASGEVLEEEVEHEATGQPAADNPKEAAAAAVMAMLKKHKKGLSAEAQQKIADAVAGSLAESEPSASQKSNVITGDFSRAARVADGDILIPQYDIRASMGHGQVPSDYVEAIRNVVISESLLQDKGVTYSSPAHLAVITGWGQSMEGTINDKDPVIVDRGINEYVGDGVYVITWAGHLFIKRLELAGENQLELISDNPNHKDRIVPMADVTIHAKVLLVWNARKL